VQNEDKEKKARKARERGRDVTKIRQSERHRDGVDRRSQRAQGHMGQYRDTQRDREN
jgi:hypothetical protein